MDPFLPELFHRSRTVQPSTTMLFWTRVVWDILHRAPNFHDFRRTNSGGTTNRCSNREGYLSYRCSFWGRV